MNYLNENYYKLEMNPLANNKNIIKGNKYRFTVLNEHVIRMEYSNTSSFIDNATQTVLNRNFGESKFKVVETKDELQIITSQFHLYYTKEKEFNKNTLKIRRLDNLRTWVYGDKIIQGAGDGRDNENYGGTNRTLDGVDGELVLEDGLFSKSGYSIIDDTNKLVFNDIDFLEKKKELSIDIYYFGYGHDFKSGLRFFNELCGETPMLPRYTFGNWWSRYWAYNEEELKGLIDNFEFIGIPLSVCIIDMDWHVTNVDKKYGSGWTGYTWNKELFPEPSRMLDYIKEKKLKTALNLHPADGVQGHEDAYEEFAIFMEIDPKSEEPIEFDCADPKFLHGYFKYLHHPEENRGIDFWWIDWQQGAGSKIEGMDPLWMLNHFHYLDLSRNNERPLIFSRWSKLGSHRYPIGFSGDTVVTWESLAFQPYFTSTAANVGYGYWSHDIGGHFYGAQEKELYTRWVQFGVFSPIMRLHSSSSPFSKREPWKWGEETVTIVKKFMNLRHELIPYIYTSSYVNYKDALPMIRPLYHDYPEDRFCFEANDQYTFGSELIVTGITTKSLNKLTETLVETYLPEGIWFDYETGQKFEGSRFINNTYKLSEFPIFAKAGAIVPRASINNKDLNDTTNPKNLIVDIFGLASNKYELYEDDGHTQNYKDNDSSITTFTTKYSKSKLNIKISTNNNKHIPNDRTYTLRLRNINSDSNVNTDIISKTYDDVTKTLVLEIKYQDTIEIEISNKELFADSSINYFDKVTELLLRSEYDDEEKHIIYYALKEEKTKDNAIARINKDRNKVSDELLNVVYSLLNTYNK